MLREVVNTYRKVMTPVEVRIEELGVARFLNEMLNLRTKAVVFVKAVFDPDIVSRMLCLRLAIMNGGSICKEREGEEKFPRFVLHYQRQVQASDPTKVKGVEALVRLVVQEHGKNKELSPLDFIPLAEASGLIKEMTLIIAERIFSQFEAIKSQFEGADDFYVGLNLPVCLFLDEDFMGKFLKLFEQHQVSERFIHVEITETGKINKWNRIRIEEEIRGLKSRGIKVSIDDFVSGYSTFRRLLLEEVDVVKIDKSWVEKIDNPVEALKLGMLIKAVKLLHPDVELVVEGLENGKLDFLLALLRYVNFDVSLVTIQSYDISGRPAVLE